MPLFSQCDVHIIEWYSPWSLLHVRGAAALLTDDVPHRTTYDISGEEVVAQKQLPTCARLPCSGSRIICFGIQLKEEQELTWFLSYKCS